MMEDFRNIKSMKNEKIFNEKLIGIEGMKYIEKV